MRDQLSNFKVTDRESFIKFLELLKQDLVDNPQKWENKNLSAFLEALGAYTTDIQGYYNNTNRNINADTPSWATFADIFMGARIYE